MFGHYAQNSMVGLKDILSAQKVLTGNIIRTPLLDGEFNGLELYFKAENFQKTGSFKIRGVLNKINSLTFEERKKGVVAVSAGNHAISLSCACRELGIPCTVIMPESAPKSKMKKIGGFGADIVFKKNGIWEEFLKLQKVFVPVHPFDDPLIIAGQGTIGLEILEDLPDVNVIIIPVGGGGLISGVSIAVKAKNQKIKIIGAIVNNLIPPWMGRCAVRRIRKHVDEFVLVSEKEIFEAAGIILKKYNLLAEPAGAASFAAVLFKKIKIPEKFKTVCVLSGGNVNKNELAGI